MAAIRADDPVITPTGRRAMVRVIDVEGFAQLVYLDNRELGIVHERLLKRLRKGQEDPPPARVDAVGRVR